MGELGYRLTHEDYPVISGQLVCLKGAGEVGVVSVVTSPSNGVNITVSLSALSQNAVKQWCL